MKRLLVNDDDRKEDTYLLPGELWWTIFSLLGEKWQISYPYSVSRAWATLARNEIKSIGSHFRRPKLTDALVSRVPNVQSLCLFDLSRDFVSTGTLVSLTRLTRLKLKGNVGNFHSHVLKDMHSLVSLTMVCMVHLSLPALTSLKKLKLIGSCNVFDSEIRRLTGLDTLIIRSCPYLTVRCLTPLISLRHLDV